MSRKRKRDDKAKQKAPAAVPTGSDDADAKPSPARLYFVAVIVAAWWLVLILMVVFTANPITLNRRQLASSPFLVTAKVVDLKTGRVEVVEDFRPVRQMKEFEVAGLSSQTIVAGDGKPVQGETYIFPLELSSDGLRVTSSSPKEKLATIYPANDDTLGQLKQALDAE